MLALAFPLITMDGMVGLDLVAGVVLGAIAALALMLSAAVSSSSGSAASGSYRCCNGMGLLMRCCLMFACLICDRVSCFSRYPSAVLAGVG